MNGTERIQAVLQGGKASRVPMMLHSFMPAAAEQGLSMAAYRGSPQNIANAHLAFARKYGLDGVLIDIDTCLEAGAMGVPVDFPEEEPARVTGPLAGSLDELIEKMEPDKLARDERVKIALEAVFLAKKQAKGELLVRGNCDQMAFSLAMLAYGMSDFMADLLDEEKEESLLLLIERAYAVHLAFHKLMREAGADLTSFGDSSCGPDLISRDMYLKYAHPFHQRLQKDLACAGIQTVCHICGRLDNILEDVAGIGFAGVEADYKTDLVRAQKALQGHSVMFGPIDPSGVFYFDTPEEVAAETRRVLEIFAGGNLVIGAGCALPKGTPEANIRAFVKTVTEYTQ